LRTQDNRATANPMFCVQVIIRDMGYRQEYCDNRCWWNAEELETAFDDEPENLDGWDGPFGYKDRWETVAVCFTEEGCKRHLELNGHNYRHRQETRIHVESFHRNPEMEKVREFLMSLNPGGKRDG